MSVEKAKNEEKYYSTYCGFSLYNRIANDKIVITYKGFHIWIFVCSIHKEILRENYTF